MNFFTVLPSIKDNYYYCCLLKTKITGLKERWRWLFLLLFLKMKMTVLKERLKQLLCLFTLKEDNCSERKLKTTVNYSQCSSFRWRWVLWKIDEDKCSHCSHCSSFVWRWLFWEKDEDTKWLFFSNFSDECDLT